jgi:hypothetical protein
VNLGLPRDTKRIQWQLFPTFVYGMPITSQPLKHHLVGFTIGLNYVQLSRRPSVRPPHAGGDHRRERQRRPEIESTPPGDKWDHEWVWGINIPVTPSSACFK